MVVSVAMAGRRLERQASAASGRCGVGALRAENVKHTSLGRRVFQASGGSVGCKPSTGNIAPVELFPGCPIQPCQAVSRGTNAHTNSLSQTTLEGLVSLPPCLAQPAQPRRSVRGGGAGFHLIRLWFTQFLHSCWTSPVRCQPALACCGCSCSFTEHPSALPLGSSSFGPAIGLFFHFVEFSRLGDDGIWPACSPPTWSSSPSACC